MTASCFLSILDLPIDIIRFIYIKLEPRDRLNLHCALPKTYNLWTNHDRIMAMISSSACQTFLLTVKKEQFIESNLYAFLISHPNDIVTRNIMKQFGIPLPRCFIENTESLLRTLDADMSVSCVNVLIETLKSNNYDRLQTILSSTHIEDLCQRINTTDILQASSREKTDLLFGIVRHANVTSWTMLFKKPCVYDVLMIHGAMYGCFGSFMIQEMIRSKNIELLQFFIQEAKKEYDAMFYTSCLASFVEHGVPYLHLPVQIKIMLEHIPLQKQVRCNAMNQMLLEGYFQSAELYRKSLLLSNTTVNI